MPTNYEWLLHMDGEERQAWFDAEHVDDLGQIADMSQKSADCVRNDGKMSETGVSANDVDANDENATCNNSGDFVTDDSREKLEADVSKWCLSHAYGDTGYTFIIKQLNRQAEITRKTEQAAWIQQANGLIHEANVRADELRDELAKRDKGIARLKRQRDEARQQISKLEAECDDCVYKLEWQIMDRLEAERDALAADLRDCERERERLRQALGTAIDHAHEIMSLVNLDGEVIG